MSENQDADARKERNVPKETTVGSPLVVGPGCTSGTDEPAAPVAKSSIPAAEPDKGDDLPTAVADLKIRNARSPEPNLLTGGQLDQEQITSLQQLGYRMFIGLRPADEAGAGWEEAFSEAAGLDFHRIAVADAADVTRENAKNLTQLLSRTGSEPAVIYCASGNRVGALLALKAYFHDGQTPEEALRFGKKAGLTRLEPRVRELLYGQ